jgi:hypothetical protein
MPAYNDVAIMIDMHITPANALSLRIPPRTDIINPPCAIHDLVYPSPRAITTWSVLPIHVTPLSFEFHRSRLVDRLFMLIWIRRNRPALALLSALPLNGLLPSR